MDPLKLIKEFLPEEEFVAYRIFGNGHINSTYLFTVKSGKQYIMQRINNNIFKNVDLLMNNIFEVTTYLKNNGNETIYMLRAKDGKFYFEDEGNFYRMYQMIDYSTTFEKAENLKMVEDAAKAFGWFHNKLAGFDGSKLGETIPFFHDTRKRYADFLKAIENNKSGKVKDCKTEIELVKKYENLYGLVVDGIKSGEVKLHVTHNDPKINNALFDINTHKFRSIIDLDTIMPGSVLYDFGDALRSLMTGDREDSTDYKSVVVDVDMYRHYLKAYYSEAKNFLTKKEIELLPYAPFLMTMECGMRFLADHFDGDVYFKIHRENHNLDRARTQINLACSIMDNIDELKKITKEIVK